MADLMSVTAAKTPIEKASAAKSVVDEFEYGEDTMTMAVEQSSLERLLSPHSRRESTRSAILTVYVPLGAVTSPAALQGELENFVYPHWLTTVLTEPLASATSASFEPIFCWSTPSSSWRDLVDHLVGRAESQRTRIETKVWTKGSPETVVDVRPELEEEIESEAEAPRAYRAFTELAEWLEQTHAETADLLGMGRTTPMAWKREGHEPQPARARRLYQTHALVSTLLRRLGREEMRRWMESGSPSPIDLIAEGDVTSADDLADELVFGTARTVEGQLSAWVDEPVDTAPPTKRTAHSQPRRVRRRPPRRRTP